MARERCEGRRAGRIVEVVIISDDGSQSRITAREREREKERGNGRISICQGRFTKIDCLFDYLSE